MDQLENAPGGPTLCNGLSWALGYRGNTTSMLPGLMRLGSWTLSHHHGCDEPPRDRLQCLDRGSWCRGQGKALGKDTSTETW